MDEVVVCGAGAAGLSAAATLGRLGLSVTVLERTDEVGASWRTRYDGLRLNTPGWMSTMPGYRASRRRYGEYPTRDDWIRYLEDYAEHHHIRVRFATQARKVIAKDEGWLVETDGDGLDARFQWAMFGKLDRYGIARSPHGIATNLARRQHGPAYDDGFVAELRAGRIEIVSAAVGFDGEAVVLADGTHIRPDAVIAATGYRRGLEGLVGHLGVLNDNGLPAVSGGQQHPSAPGLFFNGYRVDLSGQLRLMRFGARQIARTVKRESAARPVVQIRY